jgi:hypothetical protein
MSALGPGCVKTLFKSKFAANLPDFRKLQFAKALISLKLKFWRLDFNHNLIRSLTFSHSLGQQETTRRLQSVSAVTPAADKICEKVAIASLRSALWG